MKCPAALKYSVILEMDLNALNSYINKLPLGIDGSYSDIHFNNLKAGKVYLIIDDDDEDDMLGIYIGTGETQNRKPTADFHIVARLKDVDGIRWVKQDYREMPEEKYYILEENTNGSVKFYEWVNALNRVGGRRKTRRSGHKNIRKTRRARRIFTT